MVPFHNSQLSYQRHGAVQSLLPACGGGVGAHIGVGSLREWYAVAGAVPALFDIVGQEDTFASAGIDLQVVVFDVDAVSAETVVGGEVGGEHVGEPNQLLVTDIDGGVCGVGAFVGEAKELFGGQKND